MTATRGCREACQSPVALRWVGTNWMFPCGANTRSPEKKLLWKVTRSLFSAAIRQVSRGRNRPLTSTRPPMARRCFVSAASKA